MYFSELSSKIVVFQDRSGPLRRRIMIVIEIYTVNFYLNCLKSEVIDNDKEKEKKSANLLCSCPHSQST